jgi:hypothetical protein
MLPSWPCSTARQSQTEPLLGICEPSRFHRQRFASWMPVAKAGLCSHVDAVRAEGERPRLLAWPRKTPTEDLGHGQAEQL